MRNLYHKVNFIIKALDKLALDKKKIYLIILACLVILYFDISFMMKLQFQKIKNLGPKMIKLKKDINNLTKDLATIEDLERQKIELKKEALSKVKKVILEEELPLLLGQISDIANKHHIKIMQINPVKESKTEKSLPAAKFAPLFITLNLTCSYHNFGKFISDLENAENLMAVEELKIIGGGSDFFHHHITLLLKAYAKK